MATNPEYRRMHRDDLVMHLLRVQTLLMSTEHESYEGSITWEADEEEKDIYRVSGMYRINEHGGQGFVHVFRD